MATVVYALSMQQNLGVIWEVMPADTLLPRIGLGHASNAEVAMGHVEAVMADAGDAAIVGMVISPDGSAICCRRRTTGGYWWSDPFDVDNGRTDT